MKRCSAEPAAAAGAVGWTMSLTAASVISRAVLGWSRKSASRKRTSLSSQCLISKRASCEQRKGIGISVGAVGIRQFCRKPQ